MDTLFFTNTPIVELATNKFIGVPVVLKYEDTPLIEVVRETTAGFTTRFQIYNNDGIHLAQVVGSRIFLTKDGAKAGIKLDHPDKMTVCKLNNRVLFEIHREDAAALKTAAELYTPDGFFVKCTDSPILGLINLQGETLSIGNASLSHNTIMNCPTGIWIRKNGVFSMG